MPRIKGPIIIIIWIVRLEPSELKANLVQGWLSGEQIETGPRSLLLYPCGHEWSEGMKERQDPALPARTSHVSAIAPYLSNYQCVRAQRRNYIPHTQHSNTLYSLFCWIQSSCWEREQHGTIIRGFCVHYVDPGAMVLRNVDISICTWTWIFFFQFFTMDDEWEESIRAEASGVRCCYSYTLLWHAVWSFISCSYEYY